MKPILQSNTTKSVATAAAGTTAGVVGLLAWLRATFGDVLPWPPAADWAIATGTNTVIVPLVSRVLKKWKASKEESRDRMGSNLTLPMLALLIAGLSMAGCQSLGLLPQRSVTVTYPDGRVEVTTTADTEATVAMLEVQLAALEQAVATWRDIAEWQSGQDRVDAEAKAAEREQRAEQLRVLLQGLQGLGKNTDKQGQARTEEGAGPAFAVE
jgi:hypothetical protein